MKQRGRGAGKHELEVLFQTTELYSEATADDQAKSSQKASGLVVAFCRPQPPLFLSKVRADSLKNPIHFKLFDANQTTFEHTRARRRGRRTTALTYSQPGPYARVSPLLFVKSSTEPSREQAPDVIANTLDYTIFTVLVSLVACVGLASLRHVKVSPPVCPSHSEDD